MHSIKDNTTNTIIIKKSKFITKLYRINNIEEVNIILNNLNKEYSDSTHICYAYILNGLEKCFDDGEPNGTAGLPILNVLKKNNLTSILAVVIRYFGGIKLGTGGLIRAYSNSIIETLKYVDIIELIDGYLIQIEFNYDQTKMIDYILKDIEIINKDYKDNIFYKFYLNKNELSIIKELEKITTNISINDKILIEKKD